MKPSFYNVSIQVDENEFLLINPLSGSLDEVDKDVIELLDSWEERKDLPDSRALEHLTGRGYLTERSSDEEMALMEDMCREIHEEYRHYKHAIIVTYDCNMNCVYCFESGAWSRGASWRKKVISKEQVTRIFDVIDELDSRFPHIPKEKVSLYGGEPFMVENMEIIEFILEKGTEAGYGFDANTNGLDLKEFAPLLKCYGVSPVRTTLDGPPEIHDKRRFNGKKGTFHDVIEGIEVIQDSKIEIGIRVNVDVDTIKYLPELARLIQEKGWFDHPRMRFALCALVGCIGRDIAVPSLARIIKEVITLSQEYPLISRFRADWEGIVRGVAEPNLMSVIMKGVPLIPRSLYCEAHLTLMGYDPHGDIYSCPRFVGHPEQKIGTYEPLLEFTRNYERWQKRSIFTMPDCAACSNSPLCGGGCAHTAYLKTGDITNPSCEAFNAFIEHYVPYMYKKWKMQQSTARV
ncbi:MAG: radical SAM protein [Theionarchaea archaeon]|nr:radical SAM protein [Theionarchaea archaeon]MBU7001923.1 radical SAM protein [Theionarchaea archaeon]MBU7020410.1 radical SAM protein [Theionarchaea archaeon]